MAMLMKGRVQPFSDNKMRSAPTSVCPTSCRVHGSARLLGSPPARLVACPAVPRVKDAFKNDMLNRSYYPTSADAANSVKKWFVIDAEGQTLGRLATLAATYIRGKHLPTYSPSMDMGAFVIVTNAEKVQVSGTKFEDKMYFSQHYNGRPGSSRLESFKDLQKRIPERIIERAVHGMLPKGGLGRNIRLHLKVFTGPTHTHESQQPTNITSEISIKPSESAGAKRREELKAKAVSL